jgi:hypothetical protein
MSSRLLDKLLGEQDGRHFGHRRWLHIGLLAVTADQGAASRRSNNHKYADPAVILLSFDQACPAILPAAEPPEGQVERPSIA